VAIVRDHILLLVGPGFSHGAGAPPPALAASRLRAPRRLKALTRAARSPRPQALLTARGALASARQRSVRATARPRRSWSSA
jgi:hypothetical protein